MPIPPEQHSFRSIDEVAKQFWFSCGVIFVNAQAHASRPYVGRRKSSISPSGGVGGSSAAGGSDESRAAHDYQKYPQFAPHADLQTKSKFTHIVDIGIQTGIKEATGSGQSDSSQGRITGGVVSVDKLSAPSSSHKRSISAGRAVSSDRSKGISQKHEFQKATSFFTIKGVRNTAETDCESDRPSNLQLKRASSGDFQNGSKSVLGSNSSTSSNCKIRIDIHPQVQIPDRADVQSVSSGNDVRRLGYGVLNKFTAPPNSQKS